MKFKTTLAVFWFLFTFSLVFWWWLFFLKNSELSSTNFRMFAWEGSILLASVILGGAAMVFLSYRDQKRHARLRFFFSTFSHDIKTSITRLRLQSEVLRENTDNREPIDQTLLDRLLKDIARLDLQLENSLLLSNLEESRVFNEELNMSQIIRKLHSDFSDLKIELNQDAVIKGDERLLISAFRNILHNSTTHGKADQVSISVFNNSTGFVRIEVLDNGFGFTGNAKNLGNAILKSNTPHGNGIGLLLTKSLFHKMNGKLNFISTKNVGFKAVIQIPGALR